MGSGMTPSAKEAARRLRGLKAGLRSRTLAMLRYVGEQAVSKCVTDHGYTDRTGNLTSSIGYAVGFGGRPVAVTGFEPVNGATDGPREGRACALDVIARHKEGWCLVVVAGMDYASYVESVRGRDVLARGKLLAERTLPGLIDGLRRRLVSALDKHD